MMYQYLTKTAKKGAAHAKKAARKSCIKGGRPEVAVMV